MNSPMHASASAGSAPIHGRAVLVSDDRKSAAPTEIMILPAGVHDISASQGGAPVSLRVQVDPASAAAMEASRVAHSAGRQRPFFDFDHEGKAASAWPSSFAWRQAPEPGVYARVEWSDAGLAAIQGKTHRSFSPTFFADASDPAHITGAPLCMGALVNDPAFEGIRPIWAAHAALLTTTMNPTPGGTPASEATPTGAATPATAVTSAADPTPPAIAAGRHITPASAGEDTAAELNRLRSENAALQAARQREQDAQAEAAINAAAQRGAIPPQDEAARNRWRNLLRGNFVEGLAALMAIQAAPVIASGRVTGAAPRVLESSLDLHRAIKAYAMERDPSIRGALFNKDIGRAFSEDLGIAEVIRAARRVRSELPIEAANTLGTLTGTLVTQRSLQLLKFTFPVLDRITTDFSPENVMYGQTLATRTRSIPAVGTYDTTNGYVTTGATTTDVNVTMNNHPFVAIQFNANELASTRRLLFGEQEEGIHYALGKNIVDGVYALITAGNFANGTVQAIAGFGRPTLINMGRNLIKRGVPMMNRTAILYSDFFAQLATDPAIVTLAAFQDKSIIEGYQLPDVAGFKVVDAPNFGVGAPTPVANLYGAAFTPDALVLVTRTPNDYADVFPGATGGGVTSVVTNPDTGLSVMLTEYVDHKLGIAVMRVAIMWGAAVGQAASLERLTSQ